MGEPMYDDVFLSAARFARATAERNNFCRICWGPLPECPGHKGYMEMFRPEPYTEAELAEYRADNEIRLRGLERKRQALDAVARARGYEGIEDLAAKVWPVSTPEEL